MSTTIDSRVVEMRFDNKQFESNVQTSLSTLDKLKSSLNMNGAVKGFEQIDNAAKKVNMSGLGNAVESVRLKFSALEVMAVTALSNITNKVLDAGMKITKEFTLDPIMQGFSEYETQIGAVQTILANTSHHGTNLQQVNRALDELNIYADKTIYNFTEMTRNIGTFTAAGVDLQTSVDSIKGIANLAAVSGSTSRQASTAMYQLSQALAAGKVSLMDWNSVVNAGMGGKVFQDALVRTSELLGTGAQAAIDTYGSFRESLTQGEWLTTEVLTETLKQFAGAYSEADLIQQGFTAEQARSIAEMSKTAEDAATKVKTVTQLFDTLKESAQSGWTSTWEILIGDFEEAKEILTEVSNVVGDVISKSAEVRNNVLSGGLSSGWKQLLESGIADEAGYIDSIQEVARAHGDAFDQMVADSDSFSDALKKGLQEGVISSETLSDAVFNLQEKMSGMSEEEHKAAGYTSEMVTQIETLASGLRDGSISMNEFTEKIMRPSGRENLIQSLWNAAKGLMSVITPIKEAFREIFPPITADQLYKITEGLRSLTERLTLSKTASTNLKNTFKGLFAVVDIIGNAFMAVVKAIGSLLGGVSKLGGGLLSITGSFGEWLVKLDETIKSTDVFNKVIGNIVTFIKSAVTTIKNFIATVAQNFKIPGFELFHNLLERVQARMSQVGETVGSMKNAVVVAFEFIGEALANCKFVQILQNIWNVVKNIASRIANTLGNIIGAITSSLGKADFNGIIDLLNGISFGTIAIGITKFVNGFKEAINEIGSIKDSFVGILDSVRSCFEAYQSQLKAGTLLKIASAIAILTASIIAISLIDSNKLSASLGSITVLFADLMASMAVFNKISGKSTGAGKLTATMLGISTAVLLLASALKKIGDLDAEHLATGLVGVIGLTATMVTAAKVMGSGTQTIVKGSTQMVIFAAAIKVLASACKDLSTLSWEELAKGLVGVGVLLEEVSLFMNTAKFSGKSITTATGIVILAAAMKVLASACEDFGGMKWEEIAKGLVAVGALLAEIALFTNLTGNAKHVISTGVALIAIATSMKIFASAVQDFSSLSWEEIAKGLVAMAGALTAVTVAVNFMPKNMVGIGTGLIAVAGALVIMAEALNKMSGMTWEEIAKGLVTLGGAMAILAVGLNAMTGTLAGSAAMLVAASALLVLTPVLSILGAMSWEAIAKGLVSLAGAFTVIGVAGLVLTPLVPTILGLSGAFALIGVSVLGIGAGLALAGAGLSALAIGVTALAAAGTVGATAIVASLTVIITGIAELIPAIVSKIGEAIVAFCKVIADSAFAIGEAVKSVVLMLVNVFVECIPALTDGVLKLVAGILEALVEYTPSIVDSVFQFLIGVLEGIARNLPGLIQAAIDVLMSFFSGIVDALKGIDTEALLQGIVGIGLLSAIMAALAAVASLVPGAMVGVLGMGAVIAELALVLAAVGALAQIPGLEWIINEGGDLLQSIGTAIGKFIGGIVGGFASGASSQFPQIATDLSGFMTNIQPFVQGASAIDPSMMNGVKALAETILVLTAANILEGLTSWLTGGSSLIDFALQLIPFGKAMKQFSEEIAGIDNDVIIEAATAGKALAEMADTLPNTGGVVSWFAGNNDLDQFGEQLIPFGKAMKEYSDSVSGLKADVVTNSASAAKALVELANNLPNSGGVVSWFTGDNDIASFGEQLVIFGNSFTSYYNSISGIEVTKLSEVADEFHRLVDLANSIKNVDTSKMSGFADCLTSIANTGIDGFIDTFANANDRVINTANTMIMSFIDAANAQKENLVTTLTTIGSTTITNLISGVDSKKQLLKNAFITAISDCLTAMKNKYQEFKTAGSTIMNRLIDGIQEKIESAKIAVMTVISSCLTAIRSKYQDFYEAGKYLVEGLADGIDEYTWYVEAKAAAMARAAAQAAEEELDINSPSKVGLRIGQFFGMGFVNAIIDYADKSYKAGAEMASKAKNGLNYAISKVRDFVDGNIDIQPTIRPVLDLSQVRSGANRLSAMLSRNQATMIGAEINRQNADAIQNGGVVSNTTGNNYSFVQNNYSPKALSRIEIYRQTKNQFSALKGLVEI